MALRISEKALRKMWLAGMPTREIAEAFGCHVVTIHSRARAMGLPKRQHGGLRISGQAATWKPIGDLARILVGKAARHE